MSNEIKIIFNAGQRRIHNKVHDCRLLTTWVLEGDEFRLSSITRNFDSQMAYPVLKIGYWTYQKIVRHHRLQLRKQRSPGERRDNQIAAVRRHRIRTAAYLWKKEYASRTGKDPTEEQTAQAVKVSVEDLRDALRLRMGNNYGT
jgi:hypothetical protein